MVCEAGFFCGDGEKRPQACAAGTWSHVVAARNSSVCVDCPDNSDSPPNSTSRAQCTCKPSFYDEDVSPSLHVRFPKCVSCFTGVACVASGITLETLPILPGYFRASETSTDVRRCPDAAIGCGGAAQCEATRSGCAGSHSPRRDVVGAPRNGTSAALCRAGLDGIFCLLCSEQPEPVYYVEATPDRAAYCEMCANFVTAGLGVRLLVLLATLVAIAVGVATASRRAPKWFRVWLKRVWFRVTITWAVQTKLKILTAVRPPN